MPKSRQKEEISMAKKTALGSPAPQNEGPAYIFLLEKGFDRKDSAHFAESLRIYPLAGFLAELHAALCSAGEEKLPDAAEAAARTESFLAGRTPFLPTAGRGEAFHIGGVWQAGEGEGGPEWEEQLQAMIELLQKQTDKETAKDASLRSLAIKMLALLRNARSISVTELLQLYEEETQGKNDPDR